MPGFNRFRVVAFPPGPHLPPQPRRWQLPRHTTGPGPKNVRTSRARGEEVGFEGRRTGGVQARGLVHQDLGILPRHRPGLQRIQRRRQRAGQGVRCTNQRARGPFTNSQDTGDLRDHGHLLPGHPLRPGIRSLQRDNSPSMPGHQPHLHRGRRCLKPGDQFQAVQAVISEPPQRISTSARRKITKSINRRINSRRPRYNTGKLVNKTSH